MPQHGDSLGQVADAYALLEQLGASEKLLRHVKLVGEAAELLLKALRDLGISCDEQFVRLGAASHDDGKIVHPDELRAPGNRHEPAGEQLLLSHNIDAQLARVCLSHARWATMDCTFEERLIALADTTWKGKRNGKLETLVINEAAQRWGKDRWELFIALDSCFEKIASEGEARLGRS